MVPSLGGQQRQGQLHVPRHGTVHQLKLSGHRAQRAKLNFAAWLQGENCVQRSGLVTYCHHNIMTSEEEGYACMVSVFLGKYSL